MENSPEDLQISEHDRLRDLATRSQQGDKEAYRSLLHYAQNRVILYLNPRISSLEVREDLLQDILLSLHISLPSYSGRDSFLSWLFTIIRRRFIDYLRKKKRNTMEEIAEGPWFELQPAESEIASFDLFRGALTTLPSQKREAIELVHLQGFSIPDAARTMKISENNLRVTLHRATKEIKEKLRETA
ncbi:MAG: RNA polymerase sigma factor [Bdellovibrionales bacterium]|nr:RNA polymerase sigma factor [Bdellovibrionales bacterium]